MITPTIGAPTAHAHNPHASMQSGPLDPATWLARFEQIGGAYACCEGQLHLWIVPGAHTDAELSQAGQLIASLTSEQRETIRTHIEAAQALAITGEACSMGSAAIPTKQGSSDKWAAFFDPALCPEPYACVAQGVCLEPVYQDGVCFVISTTERCKAGDYVVVYFRPDVVPPGGIPRLVKRLAMGLPDNLTFPFRPATTHCLMPLVVLEQHNPPRRWSVPATDIIAIHKVIGTAEHVANGFAAWKPSEAREA